MGVVTIGIIMQPIIDQVGRALVDTVRNTMPGASFDEYFFENTKAHRTQV